MRKLLLQHWHEPNLPEIVALSTEAMKTYARRVEADYLLLIGHPFDRRLSAPCQKLHMLDPLFDDYDIVTMVDADQFPRRNLADDVFLQAGIGWNHGTAHQRVMRHLPHLTSAMAPFWGGAVYRLHRAARQRLRLFYDFTWAQQFNNRGNGEDEGIMHRLALLAGCPVTGAYFGLEWCWPSFDPVPERGKFLHVRHHYNGRRSSKMEQYRALVAKGIL